MHDRGESKHSYSNCMYWSKHCLTSDVALPEGHDVAVGTETSHAHALVHLHHICP